MRRLHSSHHPNSTSSSSSGCGFCRTALTLGDSGVLQSENFPGPYPDEQSCLWLLQTEEGYRIRLTCDTIDVSTPNQYFGITRADGYTPLVIISDGSGNLVA